MNGFVTGLVLLVVSGAAQPRFQERPCDELYGRLSATPHDTLSLAIGPFESMWDGQVHHGCVVRFVADSSTLAGHPPPYLDAQPGTDLFGGGWRAEPSVLADGPGSGAHGIRKGSALCTVHWSQPAFVNDEGVVEQSETFTLVVQCRRLDQLAWSSGGLMKRTREMPETASRVPTLALRSGARRPEEP